MLLEAFFVHCARPADAVSACVIWLLFCSNGTGLHVVRCCLRRSLCIVHSLQLQLLLCSLAAVLQPLHEAAYRLDTQLAHSAGQLRHARLAHAAGTLCWHSELALEALQLQLLLVLLGCCSAAIALGCMLLDAA